LRAIATIRRCNSSSRSCATVPETRAFIGGAYVDAADGATMPCVSPIDGRRLADIVIADAGNLEAVAAQEEIFGPVLATIAYESGGGDPDRERLDLRLAGECLDP
jgi:acyl-CoA reductase-like NAD-dependent aldehyde dehydrogenase